MLANVLRDYRSNIKARFLYALKRNTALMGATVTWYLLGEKKTTSVVLWLFGMNIWLLALAADMFPNRLSKAMQLCPMSSEERRRYLWTGFWLKILGGEGWMALITGSMMLLRLITPVQALGMSLFCLPILISINGFHKIEQSLTVEQGEAAAFYRRGNRLSVVGFFGGILGAALVTGCILEESPVGIWALGAFSLSVGAAAAFWELFVWLPKHFAYSSSHMMDLADWGRLFQKGSASDKQGAGKLP